MTFEQLAARLAGGFSEPIADHALREALKGALPVTALGELETIKSLPGMLDAAARTLQKAWRSGLDLQTRAGENPRIAAIADLECAVLKRLPSAMYRTTDLVEMARARLAHAPALIGEVEIVGASELPPPCRELLLELAKVVPVRWIAGPPSLPTWLVDSAVTLEREEPAKPDVQIVSAATARHEAVEAVRWARELVASGTARPDEIAIATTSPSAYDADFLALRSEANLDIHFVHGIPVSNSRDGQAAAALADILVRGLSRTRLRRLSRLLAGYPGPFQGLPREWHRILPPNAPLVSKHSWERLFASIEPEQWPDQQDHRDDLRAIIELLFLGAGHAAEVGERLLSGAPFRIWRTALINGAAEAIDATIGELRHDDSTEPCASILWMPASSLAACPRPFVRLLGLTATNWPRRSSEDRLLPDHIVPARELEPDAITAADRRDFSVIRNTTTRQLVLSRPRRGAEGRLLASSPLLGRPGTPLRNNRRPSHAMSETDRLAARPHEFRQMKRATSANTCWTHWQSPEITAHDGLTRAEHPLLLATLDRVQSANSLTKLLRHPLGFAWRYGLRLKPPERVEEPLVLDPGSTGTLLHEILEASVQLLECEGGLAAAASSNIADAVRRASDDVRRDWEDSLPIPPAVIWRRTLTELSELAQVALQQGGEHFPAQKSFTEVPFGGHRCKPTTALPWDPSSPVIIPETGFHISGSIDRIDVSGTTDRVRVYDYKSGRMPPASIVLQGGKELQRCLYSFAVRALLGDQVQVEATLVYPRGPEVLTLADPEVVLESVAEHLCAARQSLRSGNALIGPDAGGDYDDFRFALPANAANAYCKRKIMKVRERLDDAALVWEAE